MPAKVTTRAQVNGYRFLVRRLEHALIRADSRMIHDPMRGQMRALLIGVVIAAVIAGAAGVLAFIKPAPNFGDSTVILSKSSGSLFVRYGERLHPVLNLASARLIAGKADSPEQVDDKFLTTLPLGPAVGIVGAPNAIRGGDDMGRSSWTVCDSTLLPPVTDQSGEFTVETAVLTNNPVLSDSIREASVEQAFLAQYGGTTFLIYGGVRAAIDLNDPILNAALQLSDSQIREVSPGFLNALPLVDPIAPIPIPDLGAATTYLPATYRVGTILQTADSRGDHLHVVLKDGLQPVSAAAADIIRYGNPQPPTMIESTRVPAALLSEAPLVDTLPIGHYPTASPRFVRVDPDRVVCMSWQRGNADAEATTRLLVGHRLPIPETAQPVTLATADGGGPRLDSSYVKPGTGEFVRITGGGPDSRMTGQLFYVGDSGVRFHIDDVAAAAALGVVGVQDAGRPTETPQLAPWPVLSLLPPGPQLSQQAAWIAHDGMAADPSGRSIMPTRN